MSHLPMGKREKNLKCKLTRQLNIRRVFMKILIRFFYNNDYRFSITFLCHICLGEHDKKSQMKFNQLPNYAENFREDLAKILLYQ